MQKRTSWFAGILIGCSFFAGAAPAAEPEATQPQIAPSTPTQAEALALLQSHQFATLSQRYDSLQSAYQRRLLTDEELRDAFRVFYSTNPVLAADYAAWVAQMPRSYSAHLARGIYYKKLGMERRGTDFISNTTTPQLAGMGDAFQSARQELLLSMKLNDKPTLSYTHAMDVSSFEGDAAETKRLFELAVKGAPKDFIAWGKFMDTLTTRWGGSPALMQKFLLRCMRAPLSADQKNELKAMVLEDEAWVHQHGDGNQNAATRKYLEAAKLAPKESCTPCGPLSQAAQSLMLQKKYRRGIALYTQVLEADPNSISALDNRAFGELQIDQPKAALLDLNRAVALDDPFAEVTLAKMYLLGSSIPQDRPQAVKLLQQAAAHGYQPAIDLLPMAMNPGGHWVAQPGAPKL